MCSFTSSLMVKGWRLLGVISSALRLLIYFEDCSLDNANLRHSSSKKRLIERRATTSACQSWRTVPLASGILLEGRHFIPVLGRSVDDDSVKSQTRAYSYPRATHVSPSSPGRVSVFIMGRGGITGYRTLSYNSGQRNPFSPMISSLYWLALFRQSIELLQYSICNRVSREFHLILDSQDEVDEAEALRRRLNGL